MVSNMWWTLNKLSMESFNDIILFTDDSLKCQIIFLNSNQYYSVMKLFLFSIFRVRNLMLMCIYWLKQLYHKLRLNLSIKVYVPSSI